MARREQKLRAEVYIKINGEDKLWYEISEDGKVIWHLPQNIKEKQLILQNISRNMSKYLMCHPESALWGATN